MSLWGNTRRTRPIYVGQMPTCGSAAETTRCASYALEVLMTHGTVSRGPRFAIACFDQGVRSRGVQLTRISLALSQRALTSFSGSGVHRMSIVIFASSSAYEPSGTCKVPMLAPAAPRAVPGRPWLVAAPPAAPVAELVTPDGKIEDNSRSSRPQAAGRMSGT